VLAIIRWPHDNVLWTLGAASLAFAFAARWFVTRRGRWGVRSHILGMGGSYTLLLVAFYVDNGKQLPLWKDLPATVYWLLPTAIGIAMIGRAIWVHPLAAAERREGGAQSWLF
jgi:hypothetical protein